MGYRGQRGKILGYIFTNTKTFLIKTIRGYRTISYIAAITLGRVLPIDIHIKHHARKSQVRLHPPPNTDFTQTYPCLPYPPDWKVPQTFENNTIPLHLETTHNIFTDGSKSPVGVGAGIAVYERNNTSPAASFTRSFKLAAHCTIFQAECWAVLEAIKYIMTLRTQTHCNIYTDNLGVIRAIKNNNFKTPILAEILRTVSYNTNTNEHVIRIGWVKAHIGIPGNERADELAKLGGHIEGSPDFEQISLKSLQCNSYKLAKEEWSIRYNASSMDSGIREFFPFADSLPVPKFINLNDHNLAGIITGHTETESYKFRTKRANSNTCKRCNLREDGVFHIIFECSKFFQARLKLVLAMERSLGITPRQLRHFTICDISWGFLQEFLNTTNTLRASNYTSSIQSRNDF